MIPETRDALQKAWEDEDWHADLCVPALDEMVGFFRRQGIRLLRVEPESFKRTVNGRETVRIAEEIQ